MFNHLSYSFILKKYYIFFVMICFIIKLKMTYNLTTNILNQMNDES
jgi:hypothetical protein